MDPKILELREAAGKQTLLSRLRQDQLLFTLLLFFQRLEPNNFATGFQIAHRVFQYFAVVFCFEMKQAHFQDVVHARANLCQIERLGDEILRTGFKCAEFVIPALRGDHKNRKDSRLLRYPADLASLEIHLARAFADREGSGCSDSGDTVLQTWFGSVVDSTDV